MLLPNCLLDEKHIGLILSDSCFLSGCGLSNKRIIGGEEARENEFPWMCSLLFSDNSVRTIN